MKGNNEMKHPNDKMEEQHKTKGRTEWEQV